MNFLIETFTLSRTYWFDLPIPEKFGSYLRSILGYCFVLEYVYAQFSRERQIRILAEADGILWVPYKPSKDLVNCPGTIE